jgi:hypothetical protein
VVVSAVALVKVALLVLMASAVALMLLLLFLPFEPLVIGSTRGARDVVLRGSR